MICWFLKYRSFNFFLDVREGPKRRRQIYSTLRAPSWLWTFLLACLELWFEDELRDSSFLVLVVYGSLLRGGVTSPWSHFRISFVFDTLWTANGCFQFLIRAIFDSHQSKVLADIACLMHWKCCLENIWDQEYHFHCTRSIRRKTFNLWWFPHILPTMADLRLRYCPIKALRQSVLASSGACWDQFFGQSTKDIGAVCFGSLLWKGNSRIKAGYLLIKL